MSSEEHSGITQHFFRFSLCSSSHLSVHLSFYLSPLSSFPILSPCPPVIILSSPLPFLSFASHPHPFSTVLLSFSSHPHLLSCLFSVNLLSCIFLYLPFLSSSFLSLILPSFLLFVSVFCTILLLLILILFSSNNGVIFPPLLSSLFLFPSPFLISLFFLHFHLLSALLISPFFSLLIPSFSSLPSAFPSLFNSFSPFHFVLSSFSLPSFHFHLLFSSLHFPSPLFVSSISFTQFALFFFFSLVLSFPLLGVSSPHLSSPQYHLSSLSSLLPEQKI